MYKIIYEEGEAFTSPMHQGIEWTEVEVSFFLPEGWGEWHCINTNNRGQAVLEVLFQLNEGELCCLNDVVARYCDGPDPKRKYRNIRYRE